jgi:hypothetical protein
MKNKKHIDKLFKDRFKDFEVSPPQEVWVSIQTSLDSRKKNRKLIPLFWKVGGVAALLALLFTISNSLDTQSSQDIQVVLSEQATEVKEGVNENSSLINKNLNQDPKDVVKNTESEIVAETKLTKIIKNIAVKPEAAQKETKSKNNPIVASNNSSKKTLLTGNSKNGIAAANVSDSNTNTEIKKEVAHTLNKNEASIKKEDDISKNVGSDVAVVSKNKTVKENGSDKKSILEAINEQNKIKNDVAIANEKKPLKNRWEVAPNFAPVYYNSLSEGSSIDPSFADNAQSGDINYSYGVQVSFAINERLTLRSGISNVDLSYSTGGIEIGSSPVSAALTSVNYNGQQNVLTALDEGSIAAENTANGGFGPITQKVTNGPAELIQSITYYEVPLELKYALVNSKIGINVIGGLSTMVLGNNDISVAAGDFSSNLGEANNLSNLSFTTNIGFGVDYKLSKKIKFNIEPMFKYQLNSYSDSSVDFQPYYIGVYTGLSYKF